MTLKDFEIYMIKLSLCQKFANLEGRYKQLWFIVSALNKRKTANKHI